MATPGSKWLSSVALGVALSTTSVAAAQAMPIHAMGECETTTSGLNGMGAQIAPTSDAGTYLVDYYPNKHDSSFKRYMAGGGNLDGAPIKILAEPRHGKLIASNNSSDIFRYTYLADRGYSGDDTFVMQVEKYGLKINVHYTIEVLSSGEATSGYCDPEHWQISQIDVQNAADVQLALTTFTPENPFQPASPSQPGTPLPLGGGALALMLACIARREDAGTLPVDNLGTRPHPLALALQASGTSLVNGNFGSPAGWSTTGNVTFGANSVTLADGVSAQTRLSQAFTLGTNDRFLRFTVSGVSLQNPGDRPEDAFQVALLNAATGASVTPQVNLTRTDALLSLQGDGQRDLSQNVTTFANADGSTTYLVDLRSVPTGTAVNLAFDLIGFEPSGSHVTISDVATMSVPQAKDATFSGLENGAVATETGVRVHLI